MYQQLLISIGSMFCRGLRKLHQKNYMPGPKPEIEPQPPTQPTQPPVIKIGNNLNGVGQVF